MNNQKKSKFYWNKESLDSLREHKKQALSYKEIAEKMRLSESQISNACFKYRILLDDKSRKIALRNAQLKGIKSNIEKHNLTEWSKEKISYLKELKNRSLSNKEIAKELSTSKSSVDNACFLFRILLSPEERRKKRSEAGQKGSLKLRPYYKKRGEINKINSELGYIVGVLFGDGSTIDKGNHGSAQLKTVNKSFASTFFKALKDYGFDPKYQIRTYNKIFKKENRVYNNVVYHEVSYSSIYFVKNILSLFGPTDTKNWKINVEYILSLSAEFYKPMVRGLFDSEGCFWISKDKKGCLEFSSTNRTGAESLHLLLSHLGFDFRLNSVKRGGFYEYKIRTKKLSNIKKFHDEIGFSVDYKQEKLKDFLKDTKQKETG